MAEPEEFYQMASELRHASPEIRNVGVATTVDGIRTFTLTPTRLLTTDEMIAVCRLLATEIRRRIPERPDDWAAAIHFWQSGALLQRPMGLYFIGWKGRADSWQLYEGQDRKPTDHADWLALRERLRTVLSAFGPEGDVSPRQGEFALMKAEVFPREQWVYINRAEFLTREVVAAIQDMLKDGNTEWLVDVSFNLPPPFDVLCEGFEIRASGTKERWDRRQMEEALGDRLKI